MPGRDILQRTLLLLILAMLPALVAALTHPRRPSWDSNAPAPGEVRLSEAVDWGSKALWIDARSTTSFATSHVPGALSLSEEHWSRDLEAIVNTWAPGRKVVVYCDSRACSAGHETAERLRHEVGLDDVWVLRGGWEAWVEARR